jgi:hypothetical protein
VLLRTFLVIGAFIVQAKQNNTCASRNVLEKKGSVGRENFFFLPIVFIDVVEL